MKRIKLIQGKFAIVDNEDYDYLNQWKWHINGSGYASRSVWKDGKPKCIFMHRLVNNTPKDLFTDHINRNKLDNRKINLRTCNKAQNTMNRIIQPNNTSGYKGIRWHKLGKKWEATIKLNQKQIYLGLFKHLKDAISARQQAENKYFGEFSSGWK